MNKILATALLALPLWGAAPQSASAWGNGGFKIGVGVQVNCSWSHYCCDPCCPSPCYGGGGYGGDFGGAPYGYGMDGGGYGYPVSAPGGYDTAQGAPAYGQDYQSTYYPNLYYLPTAYNGYAGHGW